VRSFTSALTRNLPFSPFLYLFLPIDVNDFFLISFSRLSLGRKLLRKGGCNRNGAAKPGNQLLTTESGTYAIPCPSAGRAGRVKTSPSLACNRKLLSIWYATNVGQCLCGYAGLHGVAGRSFEYPQKLCNLQPKSGVATGLQGRWTRKMTPGASAGPYRNV
jgi:hypothetical protein